VRCATMAFIKLLPSAPCLLASVYAGQRYSSKLSLAIVAGHRAAQPMLLRRKPVWAFGVDWFRQAGLLEPAVNLTGGSVVGQV
jgi:hypothetical protein